MSIPATKSVWPARLEVFQGVSGLLLVLFVWAHMLFESSILLGKDAMYRVSRMFEGVPLFGRPYPGLVAAAAAVVLLLVGVHAFLALRKFPGNQRQHAAFQRHMRAMRHPDTTLWYLQLISGFCLFFLISAHLFTIMLEPGNIGPYASADRVWSGHYWAVYAPLLVLVHLHAAVGCYRLAMKWGLATSADTAAVRFRLKVAMWCAVAFFLCLGTASLVTYMGIGFQHADHVGERYLPAGAAPGGEGH